MTIELVGGLADAGQVTEWLIAALTAIVGVPPDQFDACDALDDLPVDSLGRLRVLADLSDRLGTELETELLYDCATIAELAAVASERASSVHAAAALVQVFPVIALASCFTAEPIAEPLESVLAEAGLPVELRFAPYNQILQGLLDPGSPLRAPGAAAAVVLWRSGDWFRHGTAPSRGEVGRVIDEFEAALRHMPSPGILALCPEREPDGQCDAAASEWLAGLGERCPGLTVLDLRALDGVVFDPARESVGHIPYAPEGYAGLALALARAVYGRLTPDAKVIVLDADNTLWDGVVGEDGPEGVSFPAARHALARFMAEQRDAGRLLALASKNAEPDVAAVFAARPDLPLRWADFAARRVDWNAKAGNLRAIAAELGVGVDALVFVDDSPLEVAEVRAVAPEVLAVQLPADAEQIPAFLAAHWAFDRSGAVTEEDRRRGAMMRENAARHELAQRSGVEDFLAALELEVSMTALGAADLPRAAQLTQRTNQFNATMVRHDESSLGRWLSADGHEGLAVRVRDRFGDYGFVGLVLLAHAPDGTEVDSFMLSCRVLGRRVEHRMLAAICGRASRVTLRCRATDRNAPLRAFFAAVGVPAETGARTWPTEELRTAIAAAATVAPAAASPHPGPDRAPARMTGAVCGEGLERIALRSLSPRGAAAELSVTLASRVRPRPEDLGRYVAPQTTWEHRLCALWAQELRLDCVGVHDDFYDLGGSSLDLAGLTVRMAQEGVPERLALGMLPQQTVAALAAALTGGSRMAARPALAKDAMIPGDLAFRPAAAGVPERVLLTGGTGYVGAFLLAGLMRRTAAHLDCHVRAADAAAGAERIRANLMRYGLWDEAWGQRITALPGDLAAPRLGVSESTWSELVQRCDTIVHNGATVNFLHHYDRLKDANVGGTIEALRLAAEGRPKVFHLVSTLGVLMSGGYGDRVLGEDDPLDSSEDLPNGYEQSKWVADRIVREAMARGLTGTIHRLGMLSGLMENGVYHKVDEFLPSFLKGCIQLEAFPDLRTRIEMVPVDFVCEVLSGLVANPCGSSGRVYQMNHPAGLRASGFVATIRDYGYPLRLLPWNGWKRELLSLGTGLRVNALAPYADFVRALREEQTYMPEMEMTNFLGAVAREQMSCPSQDLLLRRYLDHFVAVGYLPAPEGGLRRR